MRGWGPLLKHPSAPGFMRHSRRRAAARPSECASLRAGCEPLTKEGFAQITECMLGSAMQITLCTALVSRP